MNARTADTSIDFVLPRFAPAPLRGNDANRRRSGLAGLMRWLVEMPRRRAVINELMALSDHELADIGLVRGDLHRVFDADAIAAR